MTNRIALGLGSLILLAVAMNFALGLDAHIFLGRKFLALLEWIAFWH